MSENRMEKSKDLTSELGVNKMGPPPPPPRQSHEIPHHVIIDSHAELFMRRIIRNHTFHQLRTLSPHLRPTAADKADEKIIYSTIPNGWMNRQRAGQSPVLASTDLGQKLRDASLVMTGDSTNEILLSYLRQLGEWTIGKWFREGNVPEGAEVWKEFLRLLWYAIVGGVRLVRAPELLGEDFMGELEWERVCDFVQREREEGDS